MLEDHRFEVIGIAKAEERAAQKSMDQASDAVLASEYYTKIRSDASLLRKLVTRSRSSRCSFQDVTEQALEHVVRRARRRRRTRQILIACWKWTLRIAITIAILGGIGTCEKLIGN